MTTPWCLTTVHGCGRSHAEVKRSRRFPKGAPIWASASAAPPDSSVRYTSRDSAGSDGAAPLFDPRRATAARCRARGRGRSVEAPADRRVSVRVRAVPQASEPDRRGAGAAVRAVRRAISTAAGFRGPAWSSSTVRRSGADIGKRGAGIALCRQVSDRHHADRPAVLDHGETPYRTLAHPYRGLRYLVRRSQRGDLMTANVAELHFGWLASIGDRAHHDVAIGDDAADLLVVQHDDVADVEVAHRPGGLAHRGGRWESGRVRGHHLSYALYHRRSPFRVDCFATGTRLARRAHVDEFPRREPSRQVRT